MDERTGRVVAVPVVEDAVDDICLFRINVSPRTIARRFEEQLGTAPGQWLRAQRIARTRALLEESELSVETIAARVGLSSATNLRRRFRAALRTTPSAYRRAIRAQKSPESSSSM